MSLCQHVLYQIYSRMTTMNKKSDQILRPFIFYNFKVYRKCFVVWESISSSLTQYLPVSAIVFALH